MFERFSREARGAVIEAQLVARATHTRAIDSRHLLVAIAESDAGPARSALTEAGVDVVRLSRSLRADLAGASGLDTTALAAIGIDLDEVRRATDATFGEGSFDGVAGRSRRGSKHTPFAPDAKMALELGLREAVRLGASGIDSGHLLLGILRGGSPAAKALQAALAEAGSDDSALRDAVARGPRAA